MSKRHLAASAAAFIAAGALGQATASAATGSHAIVGKSVSPKAFTRTTATSKTVTGRTVSGVTPVLGTNDLGLLNVQADASGSTDSNSGATITSYTFDFGDGTAAVSGSSVTANHTYAKPGTYVITMTATDSGGVTASTTLSYATWGNDYTPYGPTRLLDTRNGTGTTAGIVGAGQTVKLKVGGNGTIPAGVTAVVLNITVANSTGPGFVTAYPDGMTEPNASNVNYGPGEIVPNLAIVPVGTDGYVDITNAGPGSTQIIADATGYFSATKASGYTSLTPDRILDTRNGTGAPAAIVGAGKTVTLTIDGADGGRLPAGTTAVALNVTVANSTGPGFLTAYPDGSARPNASNLNYATGEIVPNMVIAPVGADGKIDIYNSGPGATQIIADVMGYFSPDSASTYAPVGPLRIEDTRTDGLTLPGGYYLSVPMGDPAGTTNDPLAAGLTGFVFNTTVADTKANGFLTVYPDGQSMPNSSNLNWGAGEIVPNLVLATPSSDITKTVDFANESSGSTDVIVDWSGFFGTY